MKFVTALHAASIVPVWQLIFLHSTVDCFFKPHPHTPPLHAYSEATLPDICTASQHVTEEVQGTLTCPPTPPCPFMTCEHTLAKTCVLRARFSVRWQKHAYIHMCTCYISLLLSLHNASVSTFSSSWFIAFPTFAKSPLSVSDSPQIEYG